MKLKMTIKDTVELVRFARSLLKEAVESKNLSGDDLHMHLCETKERLRVSPDMSVPAEVLNMVGGFSLFADRIGEVANQVMWALVTQNDIAWETKHEKRWKVIDRDR